MSAPVIHKHRQIFGIYRRLCEERGWEYPPPNSKYQWVHVTCPECLKRRPQ